jgi:toxin ParE1/3/4
VGVKILKTSLFLKDYREIVLRLGEANPDAGERFCNAVESAFKLLTENPQIGRIAGFPSAPKIRRRVLHPFPNYSIYYEARPNEILLIRMLHGARDVPPFIPDE